MPSLALEASPDTIQPAGHAYSLLEMAQTAPNLETRLGLDFDVFWSELTNRVKFTSQKQEDDEKAAGLKKERDYFDAFVTGVLTMAERQPDSIITLLLDVDDNIGIIKEDDGDIHVLVRPAFTLAMEELSRVLGDRLELGILTTKPQRSLDAEAKNPTYLASVTNKVIKNTVYANPTYFISSGDPEMEIPWVKALAEHSINWDDEKDPLLTAVSGILAVRKAKEMPETIDLPAWSDTKLIIINQIITRTGTKEQPLLPSVKRILEDETEHKRAYVFMDDRCSANVIKSDHPRLLSVYTGELKQDVIMRGMERNSGILLLRDAA